MIFVLWITICFGLCGLGVTGLMWATRGRNRVHLPAELAGPLEPISVLKPLCGADDALEANLETFFVQDHPAYELIFGVEGEADPAIGVVRRLRRRHPGVACRLVIHSGGRGLNPKVSNLRAMLEAGTSDRVLISDSNVAVRPDYLTALGAALDRPGVGLVTSPIAGCGERTPGAALECLQLCGPIASSVAASALLGRTLVVGKSMLLRRSLLERLGGLGAVANLLAEDYVIGRMVRQAGLEVALCPQPVLNVVQTGSVRAFLARHQRWAMLRWRLKPLVYPFEVLANPMLGALLAPLCGLGAWPLLLGAALSMARDGLGWLRLRGPRGLCAALPLAPLKDLLLLGVWASAPFRRHVAWRGKRLRLSAGTLLYAESPPPAARPVRCEA